jgi:hypothetical protein
VEYNAAIKRKEILSPAAMCVDLEDTVFSETSRHRRTLLTGVPRVTDPQRQEAGWWCQPQGGEEWQH